MIIVTENGVQAVIHGNALVTHFINFSSWQLSGHSFSHVQVTIEKWVDLFPTWSHAAGYREVILHICDDARHRMWYVMIHDSQI
jgi:hypothetical protein